MKFLKELFRIGRGPSSSHTMAPARAAEQFRRETPNAVKYEVALYGSLAATGRGHFTDRAIAGVLGENRTEILWKPETQLPFHPNGMMFRAFDAENRETAEWTVYSVGGGALSEGNGTAESPEVYPFANMAQMLDCCLAEGIPLWQLTEKYESPAIWDYLRTVLEQMMKTLNAGLGGEGVLPGGLHLGRKAREIYLKAKAQRSGIRRTGLLAAYAYAVSEENASLGMVVTAPTCGSCGVLPAVLRYCQETDRCSQTELLHALAVAGLIGSLVKQNGSISGAEVGCQGEVGVACAMAAAAAAHLFGGTAGQCEYAAEIGLEHFLGLTCDPVLGLVQIPCIERNALAANRALTAAELALLSDGTHRVSFDAVVRTMLETGHDLPSLYRETSAGGLAANCGPDFPYRRTKG
ncbi:MAG: L-serine ammonia-lyase, iron-sulfur-dependent, subunit alpha [Lentisphaeria bacterium]|nr:L-serine ammonia-lyase, iron-sulfur-dependent, subunit alpha [Lentisphaeria bacterium]